MLRNVAKHLLEYNLGWNFYLLLCIENWKPLGTLNEVFGAGVIPYMLVCHNDTIENGCCDRPPSRTKRYLSLFHGNRGI